VGPPGRALLGRWAQAAASATAAGGGSAAAGPGPSASPVSFISGGSSQVHCVTMPGPFGFKFKFTAVNRLECQSRSQARAPGPVRERSQAAGLGVRVRLPQSSCQVGDYSISLASRSDGFCAIISGIQLSCPSNPCHTKSDSISEVRLGFISTAAQPDSEFSFF
jgi:hypothetical protein